MANNKRLIAEIIKDDSVIMTIDDNMLSCEFGALDRGNVTDVVDWGIYANSGSISFIDNIGYFNNSKVTSPELKKAIVKFYLAKDQKFLIATFKIDSAEFDDEIRRIDLQLIGKIAELQSKFSSTVSYGFTEKSIRYLSGLSEEISGSEVTTYPWYYPTFGLTAGEDTTNLDRTIVYCPYLEKENAWSRISKFCQATMYRVIEDEYGNPIITGSFPTRSEILVGAHNILNVSEPGLSKVANSSIDATNRTKYTDKKVESISKHFDIQYGEFGDIIGISNCEYSIGSNNDATIGCFFDTPYKIHSCLMSRVVVTVERTVRGESGTASYSTEEFEGGASVAGIDNNSLLFKYDLENIVQKYSDGTIDRKKSIDVDFYITYFEDSGITTTSKKTDDTGESSTVTISSNDLIQTASYYIDDSGNNVPLAEHILGEVSRRYSNGIECFEIECLFNDYYYLATGEKACDSGDLSKHLCRYDVIVPAVEKNGELVPLRQNENGLFKKFRIIGISYSYDGLLKQKLYVQEERYDVD